MPPKVRITKEAVVDAAVSLVREKGEAAINARAVAERLGCSTQPVFSNFATMEELRFAVIGAANKLCDVYIEREIAQGKYPDYKASGMAYIRFAKEEKELFRLLYMRDRSAESVYGKNELDGKMEDMVQRNTGLAGNAARLFHLEMWMYVHGIAVALATGFLDLDEVLVSQMVTDTYQGLRQAREKE